MGIQDILKNSLLDRWQEQQAIPLFEMVFSMAMVCLLALYIFWIYKLVTKRSFYSPNFAKTLIGMPIITTAIVFTMQINVLVSLGMVGALSIVRFRNAVKDPLDLLFLFWSISIGIICGTGVYRIAILSSAALTVVLFMIDFFPNKINSYILVLNCTAGTSESDIMARLSAYCKNPKVRTRNRKNDILDILIELKTENDDKIIDAVMKIDGVSRASLVAHDGEVRY